MTSLVVAHWPEHSVSFTAEPVADWPLPLLRIAPLMTFEAAWFAVPLGDKPRHAVEAPLLAELNGVESVEVPKKAS